MFKNKKKSKKEQKKVLIPEELQKSFIKTSGPREIHEHIIEQVLEKHGGIDEEKTFP